MKRFLLFILIITLSLFVFVGCSNDNNHNNDETDIKPTSDKEEVLAFLKPLVTEDNTNKQKSLNTMQSEYSVDLDIDGLAVVKLGGMIEIIEIQDSTSDITTTSDLLKSYSASFSVSLGGSIEAEGTIESFNNSEIRGYIDDGKIFAGVNIDESLVSLLSMLSQMDLSSDTFNNQTFMLDLITFLDEGAYSEMYGAYILDIFSTLNTDSPKEITDDDLASFIEEAHVSISEVNGNIVTLSMVLTDELIGATIPDIKISVMIDMKDIIINSFLVDVTISEEGLSGNIKILSALSISDNIKKFDIKEEEALDLGEIISELMNTIIFKKSPGVMTYSEYLEAEERDYVVVEGFIQAKEEWRMKEGVGGVISLFLMDNDGGYYIYSLPCSLEESNTYLQVGTKLRISGRKKIWSGVIEVTDITSCEVLMGSYIADPTLLTIEEFNNNAIDYMNQYFKLEGAIVLPFSDSLNEDAFGYKYSGSGERGDDIYIHVRVGENEYYFVIDATFCPPDSIVYQSAESLKIGDVIDVEGFMYWFVGPMPWIMNFTRR